MHYRSPGTWPRRGPVPRFKQIVILSPKGAEESMTYMKPINFKIFLICFSVLISLSALSLFSPAVNAQEKRQKVYVFFTCDVESTHNGNPDKDIWGKTKNGEHGIGKMMDILEKHGAKGTFFVDVYEAAKYGDEAFKNICLGIGKRGHDLELHTHPKPMFPKFFALQSADLHAQIEIIMQGKDLINKWTNKKVIAHRAGGYQANYDTLTACYENGILMDSSMNYAYANYQGLMHPVFTINQAKIFYPLSNDNSIKPYYARGVLEIPVTAYDQLHLDTLISRKFLDIEVTSLNEFKKILESAINNRVKTVVIMSHSFSFSRYNTPTSIKLEKKLSNLLNYINNQKNLELVTFRDFFNLYKKDPSVIEGNSFIPTTGIWLTYLRSWGRLDQGYKNILVAFFPILLISFVVFIIFLKQRKR